MLLCKDDRAVIVNVVVVVVVVVIESLTLTLMQVWMQGSMEKEGNKERKVLPSTSIYIMCKTI